MATQWLDEIEAGLIPVGEEPAVYDIFNTKEDFEVLNGLFVGRTAHRQNHDLHIIKSMKMWDMI
jgi:hypothetical protein